MSTSSSYNGFGLVILVVLWYIVLITATATSGGSLSSSTSSSNLCQRHRGCKDNKYDANLDGSPVLHSKQTSLLDVVFSRKPWSSFVQFEQASTPSIPDEKMPFIGNQFHKIMNIIVTSNNKIIVPNKNNNNNKSYFDSSWLSIDENNEGIDTTKSTTITSKNKSKANMVTESSQEIRELSDKIHLLTQQQLVRRRSYHQTTTIDSYDPKFETTTITNVNTVSTKIRKKKKENNYDNKKHNIANSSLRPSLITATTTSTRKRADDSTTTTNEEIPNIANTRTRLSGLCEAFKRILLQEQQQLFASSSNSKNNDNSNNNIESTASSSSFCSIDVPLLLKACKLYEQIMKDMGHTQSAKDLNQNIRKVETLYETVPQYRTIHDLLVYEKDILKIHQPNGILKDPSCAMGLLWIRRSIEFQCELYKLLLDSLSKQQQDKPPAFVANTGGATTDATAATATTTTTNDRQQQDETQASGSSSVLSSSTSPTVVDLTLQVYAKVLEPYHGWAFQKMYRAGIKLTTPPSKDQLLQELGGYTSSTLDHDDDKYDNDEKSTATKMMHATKRDMYELVQTWEPLLHEWKQIFLQLDLEDYRKAPI